VRGGGRKEERGRKGSGVEWGGSNRPDQVEEEIYAVAHSHVARAMAALTRM